MFATTGNGASACTVIDYRNASGGSINIPTVGGSTQLSGATHLNWYGSCDGVNFSLLYDGTGSDGTGTLVQSALPTSGSAQIKIPDACFGTAWLLATCGGVSSNVNASYTLKG